MSYAASNIIDLGAYREQRARKPMRAAPAAYMMCWVMFVPVPYMVPQQAMAVGA